MKRFGILLITLLAVPLAGGAQTSPGFYDQATLSYWQARYPVSTKKIFDVFVQYLTESEKRSLAGIQLKFPAYGGEDLRNDPLSFYASATCPYPIVTLPIQSLKFLDDLSVAHAWLWKNGHSLGSIADYMAVLKYSRSEARRVPPLEALQIPTNAVQDPEVDALSLRFFNSARASILAHEMGHALRFCAAHRAEGAGATAEASRHAEEEADRFALELMRRTATIPMGMVLFFQASAHWSQNRWDFQSEEDWEAYLKKDATHPLTADRLRTLAQRVEQAAYSFAANGTDPGLVRSLGRDLAKLANLLEDPEAQLSIVLAARGRDTDTLGPSPGRTQPDEEQERPAFHGSYAGDYVRRLPFEQETLNARVVFERHGDRVTGYFDFGIGVGTLEGRIRSETLYFDWAWGGTAGRGTFKDTDEGGAFAGTWGYRASRDDGGTWAGRRL